MSSNVERIPTEEAKKLAARVIKEDIDILQALANHDRRQPQELIPTATMEAAKPEVPTEDTDIRKLVDQLASFHSWRLKLLDMLFNRETRPDVFVDLYAEYSRRLDTLNSKRLEELKATQEKVDNMTVKLEQLKIRHEVGEIPDKGYITSKLELDRELSRLRPRVNILQNPFRVRLGDLPSFEASIVEKVEKVQRDSQTLGLDKQTNNRLVKDLDETLEVIRILLEEHKKIKKQMDKLEVKYKIGELKEEEYSSQKQRVERELELI